jgi:K+/H+ antiporter YhaU regulatory subunit KhtT
VALPREISERLFMLCDTTIEGEAENVGAIMAEMSRDELESVLAEAVTKLVDASFRAEKEIERFQRRLAKRRKPS